MNGAGQLNAVLPSSQAAARGPLFNIQRGHVVIDGGKCFQTVYLHKTDSV